MLLFVGIRPQDHHNQNRRVEKPIMVALKLKITLSGQSYDQINVEGWAGAWIHRTCVTEMALPSPGTD